MSKFLTLRLMATTAVALSSLAGVSWAQSAGNPDEIIVTAQKRSESLQDTPLAISAFTSETLERSQISGVDQLQFTVPNFTVARLSGYSQLSMRGIGSDLTVTAGEPTVATFVDGVYQGALFAQSLPSFDLERIEVLRGPQGTLYGRNTTGGAINYIMKPPEEAFGANLTAIAGDYGRYVVEAGLTGSLVEDRVSGRASVRYETRDGYRHNLADGKDYDDLDQINARGALLFTPSEKFDFLLAADVTSQESSAPRVFLSNVPAASGITPQSPLSVFSVPSNFLPAGLFSPADLTTLNGQSVGAFFGLSPAGQVGPDPSSSLDFANDFAPGITTDVWGVSGTATWRGDNASLKSITAWRSSELDLLLDEDGSSAAILEEKIVQTNDQFTQEFNLSGTAFGDKLDWLVGAFYFNEDATLTANFNLPALTNVIVLNASLTSATPPPVFNLSQPLFSSILQVTADPVIGRNLFAGQIPTVAFLGFGVDQKSTSIAGFGQATYALSDKLNVTGGLRYTYDQKEATRSLHANLTLGGPTTGFCDRAREETNWEAVTGTAGVDYSATGDVLLYARASRGYKAGGFNPGECSGSFDPETLWAYEAGAKTVFADGQVTANFATFLYNFQDIQFTRYIANASTIENASGAELYGAELEFGIRPRALEGLTLDGSASYLHSAYDNTLFQDPLNLATLDIGGNQLIRAPELKFNLGAQYAFETQTAGTFTLRGETSYSGEYFHDVFNGKAPGQSATKEPDYTISNVRLTWDAPNPGLQVQAFVENIEDTLFAYNRVSSSTAGVIQGTFSAPRTYGVRVTTKFGSAR